MIIFKHLGAMSPRIKIDEIVMFKAKNYNVGTPENSGEVIVTIEHCIDITLKGGFVSIECENEARQKSIIESLEGLINLKIHEI